MISSVINYKQIYDGVAAAWAILLPTAIIIVFSWVLPILSRNRALAGIPTAGSGRKDFMQKGGLNVHKENYNKVSVLCNSNVDGD